MRPLALCCSLLFLAACGPGPAKPDAGSPPPVKVTITGDTSPMPTDSLRTFGSVVENARNNIVDWSVLEPDGGLINRNGVYQSPSQPGTFTVRATSEYDPSAYDELLINVYAADGGS